MADTPPVVFVHVHYADVWAEMAEELGRAFQRPFGLVLTCRDEAMELAAPATPHLAFVKRVTLENRGRDVLPFLTALRTIGAPFEIGLKLHTKRSRHRDDGEEWRRFLTASLLAGEGGAPAALALMEREKRIGLVAPEAHLLPLTGRMVLNVAITRRMLEAIGLEKSITALEAERFAAGSMFWFRKDALRRFEDPALAKLFAPEKGQLDGTAAHAAERLFASVAEADGFLATATEAVEELREAVGASPGLVPLERLRRVSDEALAASSNPFVLPLAELWARYPYLHVAFHYAYNHTPAPIWRLARSLLMPLKPRSMVPKADGGP